MGLTPRLLGRYVYHAESVAAREALRAADVEVLPWLSGGGRVARIREWQEMAAGRRRRELTVEEKAAQWSAAWARGRRTFSGAPGQKKG